MSIASLLRLRARILRAEYVQDAGGDAVAAWREIASDLPCALEYPAEARENAPGGRIVAARARAYLPPDADVRGDDDAPYADPDAPRGRPGDRLVAGGRTWTVASTRLEAGPRASVRVAQLEALTGA